MAGDIRGVKSPKAFGGAGGGGSGPGGTIVAADVDSEASADGTVLTSDGAGGAAWETIPPTEPPDGDKGDITVSASGATWTIDDGVIGTSKMGGDVTTAGKELLNDATAADQRATLLGNQEDK